MVTSNPSSQRNRRDLRLNSGLCVKCGKEPHLPDIQIGERCQQRAQAYHRKRYVPANLRSGRQQKKRTRIPDSDVPLFQRHWRLVRRIREAFWELGWKRADVVAEFASMVSADYICGVIDYRIEAGVEDDEHCD